MVYIDGFNLYYGAVRGTPFKWLNLQRYFELVRPVDDVQLIHYFTALIDGSHRRNQETYLEALATLPKVNIVLGRYMHKPVTCRVVGCMHRASREFMRPEEKQTDVNIALQMLDDAYQGLADRMVLVNGDSDLVPAINVVKSRFPAIEIVVYVPTNHPSRGAAVELRTAADKARSLPLVPLRHAQFPRDVRGPGNKLIRKPASW
jgi:uncharacterized LabA/DUF88 family protein